MFFKWGSNGYMLIVFIAAFEDKYCRHLFDFYISMKEGKISNSDISMNFRSFCMAIYHVT
jgi:hypothetical protein